MPLGRKEVKPIPSPFGEGQTDTPINHANQGEVPIVQSLQAMLQNGTVFLFQYICADLDNLIRSYADNKGIVSRMMQLTQRQAIFDRGLSFGHIVWNDMGSIKQFTMIQAAQSPFSSANP